MELARRMPINVAVETGHAQTWMEAFAIIGRVELLLRKWCHQHPEPIELDRRQNILKEAIVVIDGDHFSSGYIAQFWTVTQKHGWRKFRQERGREVEIDIKTLQPWKHVDLHLREDHATGGLQRMRKGRIREEIVLLDLFRTDLGEALPRH